MTWLEGVPNGETDWERLAALAPETFDALAATVAAAWDGTDPVLLELARLRIAKLLGNTMQLENGGARFAGAALPDGKVDELASWPTSPRFSAGERACLALTEQFVMDANGVTDEQVRAVTEHLGGAGCYAFLQAVSVLETFQRACLTLGIHSSPSFDEIRRRAVRPSATTEVSQ